MSDATAIRAESRLAPLTLRSKVIGAITGHPVLFVFILALILRVITAFVVAKLFDGALLQPDSHMYHSMAQAMAEGNTDNWDEYTFSLFERTATFMLPLLLSYVAFGATELVGGLYVALVGAGTAAIVTLIARPVLGRWTLVPGLIIAALPSQVFWSSVTLKDSMVWFLFALLALLVTRMLGAEPRRLPWYLLGCAVALVLLAYTRQHSFVVAAWAVAVVTPFGVARGRIARVACGVAMALLLPLFVGFGLGGWTLISGSNPAQRRLLNARNAASAFVDPVENPRRALLDKARDLEEEARAITDPAKRGEATKLRDQAKKLREEAAEVDPLQKVVDSETGLAPNLRHLPEGTAVMLFAPYPWQSSDSVSLNLARVETLIWYPILILAGIGLMATRRNREVLAFPLVAGGVTLLVYALTEGNVGTAFRHRGEFVWAIAVFAGFGALRLYRWRKERNPDDAEAEVATG